MKFLLAIFLFAAVASAQNFVQDAELNDTGRAQFSNGLQKFATDDFKRQLIMQFTMCTGQCKEVCEIRIKQQNNQWTERDLEYCHYYACGCNILLPSQEKVEAKEEKAVEEIQEAVEEQNLENAQENVVNSNEDLKQTDEEASPADLILQNNYQDSTQELIDSSATETSIISVLISSLFLYAVGFAIYRTFCRYDKLFSRKQEESYLILNDTDHYQRLY